MYQTTTQSLAAGMFERGRLDHLGFTVTDLVALRAIRDRLLAVGCLQRRHPFPGTDALAEIRGSRRPGGRDQLL